MYRRNSEYCPTVESIEDDRVRICEEPHLAFLTTGQDNPLVYKIESKRLPALSAEKI